MAGRPLTLRVFKYPRRPHLSIEARLVREGPDYLLTHIPVGSEFFSFNENRSFRGRRHIVHLFWPERFYNVEMFWLPDGLFQGYYVNLALPFERAEGEIAYTDLELDISWYSGESVRLLDEDDYAALKEKYALPPALVDRVSGATAEALDLMRGRSFPFDGSFETSPPYL